MLRIIISLIIVLSAVVLMLMYMLRMVEINLFTNVVLILLVTYFMSMGSLIIFKKS